MGTPSGRSPAQRGSCLARLLATLLTALCLAAPAPAQVPECAWGDGIALPGGDTRRVLIASDGGYGLLAFTWETNPGYPYTFTIRLQHVLEQGRLDPAMPAEGAVIMSPAILPEHPEYAGVRAVPDGAGGAYLLFLACVSTLPHLRCWEVEEMRLMHVTAQGATVAGWPEAGRKLNAAGSADPHLTADIVPDGEGGVIAAWVDAVDYAAPPVRVQRFAADGTPLWPGGFDGEDVLAPQTHRSISRLAGDGAGGCAVVTSQLVPGSYPQFELRAGRVANDGSLPWSSAGKIVMTQPIASSEAHAVAIDAQGRVFVTAVNWPTGTGTPYLWSQLLDTSGARLWVLPGVNLGATNSYSSSAFAGPAGFVTVRTDVGGTPFFQLQNDKGRLDWGFPDGIAADWVDGTHIPLVTPEGRVLSLWQSSPASPPAELRAIELDASGAPLETWPSPWAVVCGDVTGRFFTDAILSGPHVFVAWGSEERSGVLPLVQRLSRAVLGVGETLPRAPLELSPPSPNPTRGSWSVRVSVREPVFVTLNAFDIAGRRVLERDLGALSPGAHVVHVDGSASLAPGLYRVRVRAGGHSAERILVHIR